MLAVVLLIAIPVLYLLPLVVVFVDEIVLRTNFFVEYMPAGFRDAFRFVYWPILYWIK